MAPFRLPVVSAAVAAALLCLAPPAAADTTVMAELREMNDSGVRGSATLTATADGGLRVVIRARGHVPGQPHAQHIHGSLGGEHFMCPSAANDTDGDGLLTNEEAAGEYGTIFLSLTTRGDTSATSGLAVDRMPVADAAGRLDYQRTFAAKELPDGLLDHLAELHVVQHGIDVNGNDKYDLAGAGVSTFAKNLGADGVPEEATDPASCGVVTGAKAAVPPHGGVETGGGPDDSVNGALAGAGGLLLAGATAVLIRNRRRVASGD
jgi:hypothetical protein